MLSAPESSDRSIRLSTEPTVSLEALQSKVERLEKALEAQAQEKSARAQAFRSLSRRAAVLVAALVLVGAGLLAREAYAAACTPTGAFVYLPALKYFCPDTPAVADDVNANTQAIVSAVEQKVGKLGTADIDIGVSASVWDNCYFALCPVGSTAVFGTTTCLSGVKAVTYRSPGNARQWYGHCGPSAVCPVAVEALCSSKLH